MKLFSLIAASTLLAAPVSAETLYPDHYNYDPYGGSGTYNGGDYTRLNENDWERDILSEETIRDNNTGDLYDCDLFGTCTQR